MPVSTSSHSIRCAQRLENADAEKPFACFTLDDGYRDNRDHAYPIFRRYGAPFTIYVPSDFADGRGDFWWLTFEKVLRAAPQITLAMHGETRHFRLSTPAEKDVAHHEIYWWLRSLPEAQARAVVAELASGHNIDPAVEHSDLVMSWDELRELAKDPLVTIGAHTRGHYALAKLSEAAARAEMAESIARIEKELGRPCRHFSYPYGCTQSAGEREFRIAEELGLETAVTTQKGLLYPEHAQELTALPRLSLNGDFPGHPLREGAALGRAVRPDEYAEALRRGPPAGLKRAAQYRPAAFGTLIRPAAASITRR